MTEPKADGDQQQLFAQQAKSKTIIEQKDVDDQQQLFAQSQAATQYFGTAYTQFTDGGSINASDEGMWDQVDIGEFIG